MQSLRFLLMIVLLAFLPLQAWADTAMRAGAPAARVASAQAEASPATQANANTAVIELAVQAVQAVQADQADFVTPAESGESPYPADNAEPSPPGADFAEQLLPAPLPRVAAPNGRSALPHYAGTALPDPDLPRLPRPPRG
ncbi:hypothetical protein SAMN05216345_106255 [Cupriavidus sp. YR651]|uniref:hypothetical protein n=1 Tax=Cupriavidus sp. YR651 TaxID=1855315 RepID=UPI000888A9B9|nr:hypothetical protein [Cupriavidus sp. YR651]SDD16046.1 hypothetical protein SAMN05216345_106255 [Cupriavidus sp. YR651]